jgi:hypothetical protein
MAAGPNDEVESHEQAGRQVERVRTFLGSVVARAGSQVGRLRDAAIERASASAPLSHGLAARERGNLEAAFWLFTEAFGAEPEDPHVAVHYWNVALELGRIDIASPAGVKLVERHAQAGDRDLAAQYWLELNGAAPDVFVSPAAILAMLPALKQRLASASAEDAPEMRGRLRRAMRHAVDPRNGELHPGIALRLFEEGRELNPEAARRAAEAALRSPNLNETKRARLEEALAPQSASGFKLLEAVPVELGEDAIVLRDATGLELPIRFDAIEAVSVVEVSGLAERRVTIIDLVRRWRNAFEGERPLVARLRSDRFDPGKLVPGPCLPGAELAAFLGEILERSRATPLPDLESALGVQPRRFDSLAEYEREVLELGSARS